MYFCATMAYKTRPVDIRQALQGSLERSGLGHMLLEMRLREAWPQILGQKAAELCELISLKEGVLRMSVRDSVWRQELHFQRKALLRKANDALGAEVVKDIQLN